MSRYVPPQLSKKNKDLDWINCLVQVHNLRCGCDTPLEHTVEEIYHQEPDLQANIPCRHTGDHATTQDGDADAFGEGDLNALFAEDFGEKEDTADTG